MSIRRRAASHTTPSAADTQTEPRGCCGMSFPASAAEPRAIVVPANTLIVADTLGFMLGPDGRNGQTRVEIGHIGGRNPFIPWIGFGPVVIPAIWLTESIALLEECGFA